MTRKDDTARPLTGAPEADSPVFDRAAEDLPFQDETPLHMDEEGNVLPGNDPEDDDPTDNGAEEQNDPGDLRRRRQLGQPMVE